ncbi:hypothetical protein V1477_007704 [Vespula maculifrons]|uniref:Uncharacterized protein n=1 Tax=Vespula maculifrons TaxID=7453 RepID=A0ABD2CFI5_VESMC
MESYHGVISKIALFKQEQSTKIEFGSSQLKEGELPKITFKDPYPRIIVIKHIWKKANNPDSIPR